MMKSGIGLAGSLANPFSGTVRRLLRDGEACRLCKDAAAMASEDICQGKPSTDAVERMVGFGETRLLVDALRRRLREAML